MTGGSYQHCIKGLVHAKIKIRSLITL